jgi:hypothetical protein
MCFGVGAIVLVAASDPVDRSWSNVDLPTRTMRATLRVHQVSKQERLFAIRGGLHWRSMQRVQVRIYIYYIIDDQSYVI